MSEVEVDEADGDGEGQDDEARGGEVADETRLLAVLVEVVRVGDDDGHSGGDAQNVKKSYEDASPGTPPAGHWRGRGKDAGLRTCGEISVWIPRQSIPQGRAGRYSISALRDPR